MNHNIPLFKIYWDESDVEAVSGVIRSGKNWAIGEKVEELEKNVAQYIGATYGAAFNSGTSALHALLIAFGIKKGDEVLVPSFTFIATSNACLMVGAKPVFVEIEKETYGLDIKDLEKKITNKTKAIIAVHYAGMSCKIEEIKKIADKHNLILIEDAAEALGAQINGKKVGTFGQASMFSFCSNKVISTGEGGIITTNSKEVYESLKLLRSHGRAETSNYFTSSEYMDYVQLGYNFRMSNITAALGVSQLAKIDQVIKMRQDNAAYLAEKLEGIKEIEVQHVPKGYVHIYQMFTIFVKEGKEVRDGLKNYLKDQGIGSRVYFDPIHLTSFYKKTFGYKTGSLKETEAISNSVLTLPMYPGLTKEEMDAIGAEIKIFFDKNKS